MRRIQTFASSGTAGEMDAMVNEWLKGMEGGERNFQVVSIDSKFLPMEKQPEMTNKAYERPGSVIPYHFLVVVIYECD